jgi:D-3-phosphoglycerate dehydrogenase / 2-oxoglutarate reductase
MTKVLLATEKPFAGAAVEGIKEIVDKAGFELVKLEKYNSKEELKVAVADVEAIIIRSDKIDKDIIEAANNLKIVVRAGAGYDNVDLEAATAKGVVVMNTPGQNSNAVAELAAGMMVFISRNGYNGTSGTELKGKNLGIHGYGHIGKLLANIAKGFGMNVFAYDPFLEKSAIEKTGVTCIEDVKELYAKSHFVSVNIPANDKTKGSINFELLSSMPKGGTLVNTARKEIINEAELMKTFAERDDFRYLSDIAPDCKDDIAAKYEGRYFFTPKKMGAQTAEANINAGLAAASQIVSYIKDDNTTFKVN